MNIQNNSLLSFNLENSAHIYCDGSYNSESDTIGVGLVVLYDINEVPAVYSFEESLPSSANSKFTDGAAAAEFMAVTKAIDIKWPSVKRIIYSDNEMVQRRLSGKLDPRVKKRASTEVIRLFDQSLSLTRVKFRRASDKNTEEIPLNRYCMSLAHNAAAMASGAGKIKRIPCPL